MKILKADESGELQPMGREDLTGSTKTDVAENR